ncbi:unnamed protein product, partial [Aureobasidium pullulans]
VMVVDKDGSKWACRTCLLGHRTVNCFLYLGKVVRSASANIVVLSGRHDPLMSSVNVERNRSLREMFLFAKATPGDVQFTASATVLVDGRALSTHSMDLEPTSLSNDRFTNERHCCCPHGGKCICIDPKQEQLQSNNVPSMKDPDTSDPHMRGKPRAAIQDSRVRLEANVNDRYELLLPNNSTHSQIRSTSKPTHWLNENYEQTTAPPFEDSSVRVQD